MAVKYPEFNELKKESAFDWLVKSEGESFTKNGTSGMLSNMVSDWNVRAGCAADW